MKASRALRSTDWSATLNLPRSSLPARPLLEKRPSYIKQCSDDLYAWQRDHRPSSSPFILHDGPPYANGSLHTGHALNKILKDIFCRFQLSQGKRVHYVPGWDCHGLPIELKALQAQKQDVNTKMSAVEIRKAARDLAARTVEEQKKNFREWAIMGDWDHAWQTMQPGFELKQLEVFKEMVKKGLIYRQYKPVYWSPSSGTALAEAELEYDENHVSHSAYVKFRLITMPKALRMLRGKGTLYALIWTTTPWTLPANSAIAVHNNIQYTVFRKMWDTDLVLCATERIPEVLTRAGIEEKDIEIVVPSILGSQIAGQAYYWNSLRGRDTPLQPIIHADFVTLTSGSGLVHMAPGHGFDDYNVCMKHNIPVFAPVDDHGCFTDAALPDAPKILKGKDIFTDGSKAVIDILKSGSREGGKDLVWATHRYKHKYPIDWRTKKPLIIRATAQWFAGVDTIKNQALASLENVKFLPETGRSRLESFVSDRSQWCISRQRAWGVPIPALYHITSKGENGEAIMTAESVQHIINVIKERGINAWWTDAEDEPAWIPSSLPQAKYRRGKDTMDVWFDSGTSWTQLPQDQSPPADVYIEGTDQHRGWFQSSLLTYVAQQVGASSTNLEATKEASTTAPTAPYKTLITHGFILDSQGRKMSKSIGNVIAPSQIIDGTLLPPMKKRKGQNTSEPPSYDAMGPDALRLWVASSDYTRDVMIGQPVLKSVNALLHKLRVTFRWLLGALEDYDPGLPRSINLEDKTTLAPRAAEYHLLRTMNQAHAAYEAYEPYRAIIAITRFVNVDLSASFFEFAKDPLYAGTLKERDNVKWACYSILDGLLTMLTPVTPLLCTEVIDHLPPLVKAQLCRPELDPFKAIWSVRSTSGTNSAPEENAWLSAVSSAIKVAQEAARVDKKIGGGLDCRIELYISTYADPPDLDAEEHEDTSAFMLDWFTEVEEAGQLDSLLVASDVKVRDLDDLVPIGEQEVIRRNQTADEWVYEHSFVIKEYDDSESDGESPHLDAVVRVMPPTMAKCPRCWRYQSPVPEQNVEVELCHRCKEAIEEQKDMST